MAQFDPGTSAPTCFRHAERETYIRCQRCERSICPDCMTPASVGFQCPECVASGRREMRSDRTAFGGLRRENPQVTSLVLIGINVGVWLLITLTGGQASPWVTRLGLKLAGYCLVDPRLPQQLCDTLPQGSWTDGVFNGAWWLPLTAVFTHVEILHIGFNMFALYVLGPQLEALVGRARFVTIYLLSGLGGSVAVLWLSSPYGTTVGASGSIFGLMAALLIVVHKMGGNPQHIVMWVGLNLVLTFTAPGISWQGHIGGFLTGGVVTAILAYAPTRVAGLNGRMRVQALGVAVVAVALLVLTMARLATWA